MPRHWPVPPLNVAFLLLAATVGRAADEGISNANTPARRE